ncbi:MAG: radical SAM protein [Thermodesulfovibrionales bacterium]
MDIKRISFIEAKSPGAHIYSKYPIPRLGAVLLSTILKERGYDVRAYIEDIAEPEWSFVENSDLVCISAITGTSIRAYKIADRLRKKGIPVVMGGAHPSFCPEEALEHSDYVVRGEGDETLPELLSFLETGKPDISAIRGVSYRDGAGKVASTAPRPLLTNLDGLPMPDFSLVHKFKSSNIYPISTSRGCPFNCRFCSVIQMFGRRYRTRSIENVIAELKHAASFSRGHRFFVDDNFAANKARSKRLLTAMKAEGLTHHTWSAQVRTDVATDTELLKLMADTGCQVVQIGFESVNPETLKSFNKGQTLEEIENCIRTVKDHGIHIHGMFVLGSDNDTPETFKSTVDFAIKQGIDSIQLMMLTPLPGTPFFTEMRDGGRLLHTDWSKYDAHHVVYKPLLMSPQTLHVESLKAMGRFYSWKYIFRHLAALDFNYVAIGLYGKSAVKKALGEARDYLSSIGCPSTFPIPQKP